MTISSTKKLVLFIHGLGGDADTTWGKFPELIRADGALLELYDVAKAAYGHRLRRIPAFARTMRPNSENRDR